jgi:ArsR family transcriptional regulator
MHNLDTAQVFKTLADDNRLRILEILQSGEKCACVLLESLEIGQPTLSHHMKILAECGLVSVRKSGKWSYYTTIPDKLNSSSDYLRQISEVSDDSVINESEECCQ